MPAEMTVELPRHLTLVEVPEVHRANRNLFLSGPIPSQIDLSGIEKSDSSALALLIEWQSRAHARDCRIEFTNPPRSLTVLARLSQASQLLGWDNDTSEENR